MDDIEYYDYFPNYDDNKVIKAYRKIERDYIILIQSERIAKMILKYYDEEFYMGDYHNIVNRQYYMVSKDVIDRKIKVDKFTNTGIPTQTIISRINDSCDFVKTNYDKKTAYEYSNRISEIFDEIKKIFFNKTFNYIDGDVYLVSDDEKILVTYNSIKNYIENYYAKTKTLV